MARIQGLAESGLLTADTQIKTAPGYVFSITIAWTGCVVGERVRLNDSDGSGGPGHSEVAFYFPTTNGTITKEWINGKEFKNGIYLDKWATGTIEVELTYK